MNDDELIGLFFERDERAVKEAQLKYGGYCFSVAKNVLGSREDAEECVSSALLKAWDTIPPKRPEKLGLYLLRITRNVSFNRFKELSRKKRGGGETALVLDELSEVVPAQGDAASEAEYNELKNAVNAFLRRVSQRERRVFLDRVFELKQIKTIAAELGMSDNAVMSLLSRTRKKLRQYLEREGLL
ncbi:MAG: sigma-70 family RNA polymerase sigma factor [Clostridiales bacterium]|nr:sigma-70 family RNA polymerase sigma factor [Clostridiales bacterium]